VSANKPATKPISKLHSLEGAILRALSGVRPGANANPGASIPGKPPEASTSRGSAAKRSAPRQPPAVKKAPAPAAAVLPDKAAVAEMVRHARKLREQLAKFGLVHIETVRFRPRGLADRRLIVEYAPDPEDAQSVLMRVRPASSEPLPGAVVRMLTTQQAADQLNVSRPYVARLVDEGKFDGVERTQSGHRRIPATEVDRLHQEMRSARRAALDVMADLTKASRARELDEAKTKARRRWVAKQG
jgi:excisionase family DNA binding protein